jgi:hypothetical protein
MLNFFFYFEFITELYVRDKEFEEVFRTCEKYAFDKFYRHEGFLFREGKI